MSLKPNDELLKKYAEYNRILLALPDPMYFKMPYGYANTQRGALSQVPNHFSPLVQIANAMGVAVPDYEKEIKLLKETPLMGRMALGDVLSELGRKYSVFKGELIAKVEKKIKETSGWDAGSA